MKFLKKKKILFLFGVVGVFVFEFILFNNDGNLNNFEDGESLIFWEEVLVLFWKSFWNLLIIFCCCLVWWEIVLLFVVLLILELDVLEIDCIFNGKKSMEELFLLFLMGSVLDIFSGFKGVSDVMLNIIVFMYV